MRQLDTMPLEEGEMLAAVDLGSNSFHIILARYQHGEPRVVDRVSTPARLSAGIDAKGRLDPEHKQRALTVLAEFGQRIAGLPAHRVRAVATNAVRRLAAPRAFLDPAEAALGHPIEVVSGREEARLIWSGVVSALPASSQRRLVVDIGGGSSEFIIGQGSDALLTESVQIGCVDSTARFFADGKITAKRWRRAQRELGVVLQQFAADFREMGWDESFGSSGTVRAVENVARALYPNDTAIERQALEAIVQHLLEAGSIKKIRLPGLSADRVAVIAGGVLVLQAVFDALDIQRLQVSDAAMREGLLWSMIGRAQGDDPRDIAIAALVSRYAVDCRQAGRVADTAQLLLEQVRETWDLGAVADDWLAWCAQVHEIGLAVSHSRHHRHAAYILEHSELAGFSQQEQLLLAIMIANHRRKPDRASINRVSDWQRDFVRYMITLLRLAVLLHRARDASPIPPLSLEATPKALRLRLPATWCDQHPLTMADLEREAEHSAMLGVCLEIVAFDDG